MMRSLSSGVAGLRTHQTKMDVIGNNIANVNTYGYKSSRTTFNDVYYQSLSSGSGPAGSMGGTNPTQIGYGSSVATIDVMHGTSAAAQTDREMDVFISGDGFLVTKNASDEVMYTRMGSLYFDEAGQLVDGSGSYVQGFPLDAQGKPIVAPDGQATNITNITVDPTLLDKLTGVQITANGKIIGVLPGDKTVSLGQASPDWINKDSLTIPADSNYTGNIGLKVRGEFAPGDMAAALTAAGITGATVANPKFSEENLLSKITSVKADGKGNITVEGEYVNAAGTLTKFSSTAKMTVDATGSTTNETLSFKFNGKELFSIDVAGATFPPYTAPTYGSGGASTGADAEVLKALQDAGLGALTATTVTKGSIGADPIDNYKGLTFTVNAKGEITVKGEYALDGSTTTYVPFGPLTLATNPDANGDPTVANPWDFKDANGDTVLTIAPTGANWPRDPYYDYTNNEQKAGAINDANITYVYKATIRDKGDNIHKYPEGDGRGDGWGDLPNGSFQFGDVTMTFDPTQVKAYNSNVAKVDVGDSVLIDLGCLVLAKFPNNEGLEQVGTTSFAKTANSGEPAYYMPGVGATGSLKAGYLEQSNVDIAKEFSDMITTQRGFQANTRIITTSDEMLQELVNLKR